MCRRESTCVAIDRRTEGCGEGFVMFVLSLPLVSFVRGRLPIDGLLAARDGADGQGGA